MNWNNNIKYSLLIALLYILYVQGYIASDYGLIGKNLGGFNEQLVHQDRFGSSIANIGDFDGDGVADLIVGSMGDSLYGTNKGTVYLMLLNSNGTVKSYTRIVDSTFASTLPASVLFGASVASIGDIDGDGVTDIVVGSYADSFYRGAVWVILLNTDGSIKSYNKIPGVVDSDPTFFGDSVSSIGDLNQDGVNDIVVGSAYEHSTLTSGGLYKGAVWIMNLDSTGNVIGSQRITEGDGGFTGTLNSQGLFGSSVSDIGDLDGDGISDIAVGAPGANINGFTNGGAVWILFMNSNGTVKSSYQINDNDLVPGTITAESWFGSYVTSLGDLDGDGVVDLGVSALVASTSFAKYWILYLNSDGTVKSQEELVVPGRPTQIQFGYSATLVGNLNGQGVSIAIGAIFYHYSVWDQSGAVYILNTNFTVSQTTSTQPVTTSSTQPGTTSSTQPGTTSTTAQTTTTQAGTTSASQPGTTSSTSQTTTQPGTTSSTQPGTSSTAQTTTTQPGTTSSTVQSTTTQSGTSTSSSSCLFNVGEYCVPGYCAPGYYGINCDYTYTANAPLYPIITCAEVLSTGEHKVYFGFINPLQRNAASQILEEDLVASPRTVSDFNHQIQFYAIPGYCYQIADWILDNLSVSYNTDMLPYVQCPAELLVLLQLNSTSGVVLSPSDEAAMISALSNITYISDEFLFLESWGLKRDESNLGHYILTVSTDSHTEISAAQGVESLASIGTETLSQIISNALSMEIQVEAIPLPTGVEYTEYDKEETTKTTESPTSDSQESSTSNNGEYTKADPATYRDYIAASNTMILGMTGLLTIMLTLL